MIYEALLLAAVELFAIGVFLVVTRNQHSPTIDHARQFVLFLVTAAYFIHFWFDSGHTLAMKTWRIKLVMPGMARVPLKVAAARYLLAWGWFVPALLVCYIFQLTTPAEIGAALLAGMAAWAFTVFFDKDRQFLHDRLLGTRLIALPKASTKATTPA